MKNNSTWILLCLACMMTLSCSDKKNTADESEKGVSTVLPDTKNEVAVQILKKRDFNHELVSNGKISARGKADLRFETGEVIAHIYVKNGDRVQKGQKLADLDKFRLEQKLSQSEDALLKAELELKDVLIGQGYSHDDFSKVPAETMKIAKVKSGYEQSKSQYELAKREMEHATLIAPFDGVVANLFSKPYNPANTSEAFCTIIDSKGMEADFTVLENELAFIRMGDKVVITPYAGGDAFEGSVEIEPWIDYLPYESATYTYELIAKDTSGNTSTKTITISYVYAAAYDNIGESQGDTVVPPENQGQAPESNNNINPPSNQGNTEGQSEENGGSGGVEDQPIVE